MGKNRREKREEEREGFASKRTSQYRMRNLKALGILSMIGVIVSFACYEFVTSTNNVPGAPENAGKLGAEHIHASMLVNIFGDKFDFSTPNYQVKTPWIHFENQDGDTIHRHSTGVELEFLFNSMNIATDENCFVFPDGRQFCTNEDYSLKFYINQQLVEDIRKYIVQEDDRILITYGNEDQLAIDKQLAELNAQAINRL
ncbi:MAG: protein-disulfide isomerase [Thaumarchaeota archaeon]|nr:protein-disulfide isomerase [Nitrososphaerota archaeon]MBT4675398.1 protein-disulfide isomerase [Nitrososphaerota archaeon]MBT5238944.1 protein-disulfide isomerase [Nitrososphaerota archaeon]MBT7359486.1 protein-disulfide isomerase [Nitrososphaerota archaeon]MDC0856696.1 protein-disulfide isomerase [Candidatus Nitrosopelagicus sp.]